MSTSLIISLLETFYEKLEIWDDMIHREAIFSDATNKIKVAIGMRRTGKTQFLFQKIRQLLAENVPLNSILYINFEDERLYPLTAQELGKLLDSFYFKYKI